MFRVENYRSPRLLSLQLLQTSARRPHPVSPTLTALAPAAHRHPLHLPEAQTHCWDPRPRRPRGLPQPFNPHVAQASQPCTLLSPYFPERLPGFSEERRVGAHPAGGGAGGCLCCPPTRPAPPLALAHLPTPPVPAPLGACPHTSKRWPSLFPPPALDLAEFTFTCCV